MSDKQQKHFALVLHAHLPFVIGHGQWPHGMDWLNEAAAETYIPLLNVMNRMKRDKTYFRLTLDISPVLGEQLDDDRFKEGFIEYLDLRISMSEKNLEEFIKTGDEQKAELAKMWHEYYSSVKTDFLDTYKQDIIAGFRDLQDEGYIEIITCGATHGYFPLLYTDEAIEAQVKTAVRTHERLFGKKPAGIWLPECAYRPRYEWKSFIDPDDKPRVRKGVEEFLAENGIKYFVVDSHLLKGGKPIGTYLSRFEALKEYWEQFSESYMNVEQEGDPSLLYWAGNKENNKMAAVFARNEKTSLQVWSGEYGYPGNGLYLDFHKKHFPGGNRYWAVTSAKADLADKKTYQPHKIEQLLHEQAKHFTSIVAEELNSSEGGILTAPFDCELFGHWWFEGPRWLEKVFKEMAGTDVKPVTMHEEFSENPPEEVLQIPEGSWGEGGFHYVWLNDWTKWTWKHLHNNELNLREKARKHSNATDTKLKELLNQMARELLLQQASDWQFLITTWSARDYAEQRFTVHDENFKFLLTLLEKLEQGEKLSETENARYKMIKETNSLFRDIDFKNWK